MPGIADVPYLTNTSMMDVDFVPPHLVVVGGSYIGLEFAQMFRRFGSDVTVIEMGPRLIAREDEDMSAAIREILERRGHRRPRWTPSASPSRRRRRACACGVDCTGRATPRSTARTCCSPSAAGPTPTTSASRRPASRSTRAATSRVDDELRTNVPGIWALGDCNGRGAFTHTSYNDFEIVAANLLDGDPRRVSDRIATYALFIDPPLGRAGMTEAEVRKAGPAAPGRHSGR